jgi:hypothetical protein
MRSAALAALLAAVGASVIFHPLASAAAPPPISVRWRPDPADANKFLVEVSGLSPAELQRLQKADWQLAQWQRLLPVYAQPGESAADPQLPPMLGAYRVESGVLRFEPQFRLEPGLTYRAVFWPDRLPGRSGSGGDPVAAVFRPSPRDATPTTVVSQIYPSARVLPENLLKFYIHFSAPMSRGQVYEHIHLRDEQGGEVELPFLEIGEELWDPGLTRLTLLIDPGRIKRGVRPLEEVGAALEVGQSYRLVIDRDWKDGDGKPLREGFEKAFKVGPADREPPDPARWQIQPPSAGTLDPVAVNFPEPLDHALTLRVIHVTDEAGQPLAGHIALEAGERRWTFAPGSAWRRGTYTLVIETTLEDLGGNNIGKQFDVDLFDSVERRLSTSTVKRPFEVR